MTDMNKITDNTEEEPRVFLTHRRVTLLAMVVIGVVAAVMMAVSVATTNEAKNESEHSAAKNSVVVSKVEESSANIADHYMRLASEGPGHIEPVDNCFVDGTKGYIDVDDLDREASFKLVYDEPNVVADVRISDAIYDWQGDVVTVFYHDRSAICDVEFRHFVPSPAETVTEAEPVPAPEPTPVSEPIAAPEPTAEAETAVEAAPDTNQVAEQQASVDVAESPVVAEVEYVEPVYHASYDWYAPVSDEPSAWGLVDYQGLGWYCAHSYTDYGYAIAALQPGDQVRINGRLVTIEGRARNEIDTYIWPLWDEIGRDKVLFSTCCEDGSNDVWVIYGE